MDEMMSINHICCEKEDTNCKQCNFKGNDIKAFVTHIINAHGNNSEVIHCPHCDYKSIDMETMKDHIETVHLELALLGHITGNQDTLNKNFDKFKTELTTALNAIIEGHNAMKQELFIMRQKKADSDGKLDRVENAMRKLTDLVSTQITIANQSASTTDRSSGASTTNASRPCVPLPMAPVSKPLSAEPTGPAVTSKLIHPASKKSYKSDTKIESILLVGDSIAGNAHLRTLETATKADVKLVKAYSSSYETSESPANCAPRFPAKNFIDVIENELKKTHVDALIVQAGSVDITNLKTEAVNANNHLEYFKQKTVISANNVFQAVTNAAKTHPELKKIILMKQVPRYDNQSSNPPGLKPFLSNVFNETLDQLCRNSTFKNKLSIDNHNLECSGGRFEARYRNIQSKRFDGIHLYGPSGMKAYTASILNILSSAQLVKKTPPKYYDEFEHMKCDQARYQARQQFRVQGNKKSKARVSGKDDYQYTVPTYNKYAGLGNNFQGN